MFIYDVIHSEDEEMQKYIKKNCDIHSHYTRGQQKFHMPNQNNKTGQKSLFIKGLKIYNSVPEAIKSEQDSRNVFKKRVIQYIKERIPITPST